MNSINYKRSPEEKTFLVFYFPFVLILYLIYKYPTLFVKENHVRDAFYFFGKSTSFWYGLIYTLIVCAIATKLLLKNVNPYSSLKKNMPLSSYQKKKFTSILISQSIFFFFIPFILPWLIHGQNFWNDPYKPVNKDAYVYVYNGFRSFGGFIYIFVLIPVIAWLFGKRYCSWFCACGNLAETVGVTKWGKLWVRNCTPRGSRSHKIEVLQFMFLVIAIVFGLILLLDALKIISAPSLLEAGWQFQYLVTDLIFGSLIGVGAYPVLGTRIWCRYGCPLAQLMKLFAVLSRSKYKIIANGKCKGIGHCSFVCPMGIDVASYAHKDRKPVNGSFGLKETPCIGCGSCIDSCPVNALSFEPVLKQKT